jgi:hypothetical protein
MPTATINCIVCKRDILSNLRNDIHSCKEIDTNKIEWAESSVSFTCQGQRCGFRARLMDYSCDDENYAYCPDCSSYKLAITT